MLLLLSEIWNNLHKIVLKDSINEYRDRIQMAFWVHSLPPVSVAASARCKEVRNFSSRHSSNTRQVPKVRYPVLSVIKKSKLSGVFMSSSLRRLIPIGKQN